MIEQRTINGSFTEIYVGGGNWLTQSFPTNFHTFHHQITLSEGASADKWKEVTDAEKTKLEAADALWVRPPQVFIDLINAMATRPSGGSVYIKRWINYNPDTGYFELHGVNDITYDEAVYIYEAGIPPTAINVNYYTGKEYLRVNIDCEVRDNFGGMFRECKRLEVAKLSNINTTLSDSYSFSNCLNLHTIIGKIINNSNNYNFSSCNNLQNIQIQNNSGKTLRLNDSPLISLESFKYMVDNSANGTIIVHTDVYAKLTDPSNAEWHKLNEDAVAKQILFATA